MQGVPNQLEGFRKNRAHEGIPVTAGETSEVLWAFVKVVSAVPLLIGGIWVMSGIVSRQGGIEDLQSRVQLAQMNAALGYDDPMRYLQILGPWVAIGLVGLVGWMILNKNLNDGEARLKKANGDAHRRDKRRRLGIPEDW